MRKVTKIVVGVAAASLLAGAVTACSSSKDTKPVATIPSLTGNSTSVALDAGFLKDLTALKLTPGLVGTATMPTAGTLTFPITGGHVTVYKKGSVNPYVQGDIQHNGSGFTLTSGATKVTLENFDINPGKNAVLYGDVLVNGASAAKHAPLFTLHGSTLKPITIANGVATLTGTHVNVSPTAASLLDKTFNTTAVTGGLLVGVATILAKVS
ncbi:MAG: hypothetical protein ABI384_01040 [Allobranchiibius sp.]